MTNDSRKSRGQQQEAVLFCLALVSVALIYVLTLATMPPHVFWSPDEGGKFLQMLGMQRSGDGHLAIPYGGLERDPLLRFYPPGSIYPRPTASAGVRFWWPKFFAVASSVGYGALGLWGLYILPVSAGILAAALSGLIVWRSHTGWAWVAVLATGLCTPLWFYSVLFWEHSFAVCMGLGAVYSAKRLLSTQSLGGRTLGVIFLVVCLALSVLARFEMLIFVAAFLFSLAMVLWRQRSADFKQQRKLILCVVSVLILLGGAIGSHMLSTIDSGSFPSYWSKYGNRCLHTLSKMSPSSTLEFIAHAESVLINDTSRFGVALSPLPTASALFILLASFLLGVLRPRTRRWLVPCATVAISVVSCLVLSTQQRHRAFHGIFLAVPYGIYALGAMPSHRASLIPENEFTVRLGPVYIAMFVVGSFMVNIPTGGPEWGTRYGLMAFPLLAILAVMGAISLLSDSGSPVTRAVLILPLVLGLAIGRLVTAKGIAEIQVTKRDLAAFESRMRRAALPVVTDQWWMGAALGPYFAEQELYTVVAAADVRAARIRFITDDSPRFMYVSYGTGLWEGAPDAPIRLLSHSIISGMSFRTYEVDND